MSTTRSRVATLLVAVLCSAQPLAAMQLFSDGFDSLANWTVVNQPDSSVAIVDYSSLGVPEAPNTVGGTSATTGAKFVANISSGNPAAVNLIGAIAGGNADLSVSRYAVTFDMYLSVDSPLPSGSTEQGIWGVGRTTTDVVGRNTSQTAGDGVFGWLATENGYLEEDAVAFVDTNEYGRYGGVFNQGLFNSAFAPTISGDISNSPANQWVAVTVTVDIGRVHVDFNSTRFFSIPTSSLFGDVMVGYEDSFSSISSSPDQQFGLIDNLVIYELPPEFSGYYDPANWTTTTSGFGGVNTAEAPDSIALINSEEGNVEYSIEVPADGNFSFRWTFFNFDFSTGANNGHKAAFLVNEQLFDLSDQSFESGNVSVPVSAGDTIGWRIDGSPGAGQFSQLFIEDFSAPIPEPTSFTLLALTVIARMCFTRHGAC